MRAACATFNAMQSAPPHPFQEEKKPMEFTPTEQALLRIAQKNIPDTLTPYADMAKEAGCAEEDVLALLSSLKESGAIRRFGASIRHQRTGWTSNFMVAWIATEQMAEEAAAAVAAHAQISHCYYRPSAYPEWPYAFYTMIHGRSDGECLAIVEELKKTTCLETCEILKSVKELKKISMTYFA